MKVKELFAILKREPANWDRDLIVEVQLSPADVERARIQLQAGPETPRIAVLSADVHSGETTLEEPRSYVLRIKVTG